MKFNIDSKKVIKNAALNSGTTAREDSQKTDTANASAAKARMEASKNLQNSIKECADKMQKLLKELREIINPAYIQRFNKTNNIDLDSIISYSMGIKPDGTIGPITIGAAKNIGLASLFFIDYFSRTSVNFQFTKQQAAYLTSTYEEQSVTNKLQATTDATAIIKSLQGAISSVNHVEFKGKSGDLKINSSSNNDPEKDSKYAKIGWMVNLRRWTGKNDLVAIYVKDVKNRSTFESWKKENKINSNEQEDAQLIMAIEAQFGK